MQKSNWRKEVINEFRVGNPVIDGVATAGIAGQKTGKILDKFLTPKLNPLPKYKPLPQFKDIKKYEKKDGVTKLYTDKELLKKKQERIKKAAELTTAPLKDRGETNNERGKIIGGTKKAPPAPEKPKVDPEKTPYKPQIDPDIKPQPYKKPKKDDDIPIIIPPKKDPEPKKTPKVDPPKKDPKVDPPKVDPKPKETPKVDPPKETPKVDPKPKVDKKIKITTDTNTKTKPDTKTDTKTDTRTKTLPLPLPLPRTKTKTITKTTTPGKGTKGLPLPLPLGGRKKKSTPKLKPQVKRLSPTRDMDGDGRLEFKRKSGEYQETFNHKISEDSKMNKPKTKVTNVITEPGTKTIAKPNIFSNMGSIITGKKKTTSPSNP